MFFGKVVGTVVAAKKDIHLSGMKLLVVQKTDNQGIPQGECIVAVDFVQAGQGDFVFLVKSKDAGFPVHGRNAPVDAGVVGIIDSVILESRG